MLFHAWLALAMMINKKINAVWAVLSYRSFFYQINILDSEETACSYNSNGTQHCIF